MRTRPVRHTVNAVTFTSLMSFTVLLTLAIFVMSAKSGVNSSGTLLRIHLVDFVTITGGLALVLTDGGHRPIPGFDPSPYGELRRYRLHHVPGDRLQDELDRSRLRDVAGEVHETTRFRPDLLVLVTALVLIFLVARAIGSLFAS